MLGSNVFSSVPFSSDLNGNKVRMVLRWNMWNNDVNKYTPHAIYAKEYNPNTEMYSCINSWGHNEGHPQIHKSGVESIYYVTIKQTTQ